MQLKEAQLVEPEIRTHKFNFKSFLPTNSNLLQIRLKCKEGRPNWDHVSRLLSQTQITWKNLLKCKTTKSK